VLHHGKEDAGITIPDKEVVYIAQGGICFLKGRDLPVVIQQYINGDILVIAFYPRRHLHGSNLVVADHQDHHIEVARVKLLNGLFIIRNPCHPRHGGKIQLGIFSQNMLRKASLLLNAEGIVEGGHQQDLLHLVSHQVVKDIAVGILLGQKFLQQHPGINLAGMLKLAELLPHSILFCALLQHLTGFLTIQVVGDNTGQVFYQLPFLFQKGPLIQFRKSLEVVHLNGSFPHIDGLKLLNLSPVTLPKALTGIILSLEPDPGHGHFGILPCAG